MLDIRYTLVVGPYHQYLFFGLPIDRWQLPKKDLLRRWQAAVNDAEPLTSRWKMAIMRLVSVDIGPTLW